MSSELLSHDVLQAGYALAVQMLRNHEDAADAVQEAAQKVLRTRVRFNPVRGSVRAWFLQIVRNCCLDGLRQLSRRADDIPIDGDSHSARSEPPDERAEQRELHQRLHEELLRLSNEHREILLLRDWHDLPYSEIAEVLQIPPGTVMSRLSRAREELRQRMLQYR